MPYIYLLKKSIANAPYGDNNIYKIGRTDRPFIERYNEYRKDPLKPVIIFVFYCNNTKIVERELLNIFKKTFKRCLEIGNEYFTGDEEIMKQILLSYFAGREITPSIKHLSCDDNDDDNNEIDYSRSLYETPRGLKHLMENCLDKIQEKINISNDYDENLLKYNDLVSDDNAFRTHLKIRCLLYDDETLTNKLKGYIKTDYHINLSKSDIFVIINYKRIMRTYLPEIDLYNYEYKYDDKYLDDDVNIDLDDFKCIKNVIRTTKKINLPTNKKALVDLMNLYATHIFSKDLIKSVKVNKKIKGKSISFYYRVFNKDLFNNHLSLYKIYIEKNKMTNICNVIKHKYYKDIYNDVNEINNYNILT